jgi:hypothetical protein
MDATWNKICPLVKPGDLHAHSAKVSTAFNDDATCRLMSDCR